MTDPTPSPTDARPAPAGLASLPAHIAARLPAEDTPVDRPRIDTERRTPLDAGTDSSEPSTGLSGGGGREADAPPTVADPASTTCSGQGTTLTVPDSPKMLRETLCVAQTALGLRETDLDRKQVDIARLGRLVDACDRHRPLGPDGKHGDRHTPTCGCDTVQPAGLVARDAREDALDLDAIAAGEVGGDE